MYLDKVSELSIETKQSEVVATAPLIENKSVYSTWENWLPSQISHHGKICCEIAREWITATDFSELNGESILTGPRWLRQRFCWGASTFPIYWCEAVRRNRLDCGALAALAREVFTARGVRNYSAQLVQRFSELSTDQWADSWSTGVEPLRWVDHDLIYHEGCAIDLGDSKIKVWDASAGWWVDPKQTDGYGAVLSIRVSDFSLPSDATFRWGEHLIRSAHWTRIN
jgi:hypothetical protein